jgi:transcriptional regulator with XRE-family HTH domain
MNNEPPTLGILIRGLRTQNGWTLQQMSDKTGIPRSTLAKVEHGRLTLGYDKLMQISKRLNVRMSELFSSGDEPAGRAMTRRSVGTTDSAIRVETPNYEYFFLCPDLRKKRMIPIFGYIRAKTVEEFGELIRHPGEEFIYVLTGRVAVHTEFYEPVILEPGQCAYIDSSMGHAYILGPGCEEASLLAGCTSPDDELIGLLRTPELLTKVGSIEKSPQDSQKKPRRTKKTPSKPAKYRR